MLILFIKVPKRVLMCLGENYLKRTIPKKVSKYISWLDNLFSSAKMNDHLSYVLITNKECIALLYYIYKFYLQIYCKIILLINIQLANIFFNSKFFIH